MLAFLGAWHAPRSEVKFRVIRERYIALRIYFTREFDRVRHTEAVRSNPGIIFYAQAKVILGLKRTSLAGFERAIPFISAADWRRILNRYASDLDAVFAKLPACPETFDVYRGLSGPSVKQGQSHNQSFTSTSLDIEVASYFAKPTLLRITIPQGSHTLPLISVSRYPEMEILLPRALNKNGRRGRIMSSS